MTILDITYDTTNHRIIICVVVLRNNPGCEEKTEVFRSMVVLRYFVSED